MPQKAEVLILGAGVIGSSVAWHLARRGLSDVLVIDRAEHLGEGSTGRATGGFRAQFADEIDIRLSLMSRAELEKFEELTGFDSGYRRNGYLFLARTDDELDSLRDAHRVQHACGLAEARMIGPDEACELNPAIEDPAVIGGAFCDTDGFIRPMSILEGYAMASQRMGVRYELGVEWLDFRNAGGRIVSASTSRGDFEARIFVNALGAWAGPPVRPVRRNVAATAPTDLVPESAPMTIWSGDWFHLRERDGRVLLLWPDDPPIDDAEWLRRVQQMTRERIPRLASLPIADRWSGFYEMTPDEHSLLGLSPTYENLYLAAGASGHGVMHAPALGDLLAQMIVDGKTTLDISPLDPARFG